MLHVCLAWCTSQKQNGDIDRHEKVLKGTKRHKFGMLRALMGANLGANSGANSGANLGANGR